MVANQQLATNLSAVSDAPHSRSAEVGSVLRARSTQRFEESPLLFAADAMGFESTLTRFVLADQWQATLQSIGLWLRWIMPKRTRCIE